MVQTITGTGGECTFVPAILTYVKINCGSTPAAKDSAYYEGKFFDWLSEHKVAAKVYVHIVSLSLFKNLTK